MEEGGYEMGGSVTDGGELSGRHQLDRLLMRWHMSLDASVRRSVLC